MRATMESGGAPTVHEPTGNEPDDRPRGEGPLRYLTVSLYHPNVLKGGAQYVAKDLHDAAAADPGVEARMLAAIDGNAFPQYGRVGASITGLPGSRDEFVLPTVRFDEFRHLVYDPRRNKAVRRFLEMFRPDVVHVHHSLMVGLDFLRLVRRTLPQARILYTLHEYLPICHARGHLFRAHERAVCRNTAPDQCTKCFPDVSLNDFMLRRRGFHHAFGLVDHFVAPSAYLRERYVEWGLAPERISVIPNGHRRQRPDGWTPTHSAGLNRFGFFGQFVDSKGIDVLLRAAALAARSGEVEVVIHGGNKEFATPDYLQRIEAALEGAPETLRVVEHGSYSRENVFDLMRAVDWVVVPSVWPETFGLVISEAWDARRPVIGSDVGGIGERVRSGVDGLTFNPGAAAELGEIMRGCVGNGELWARLSERVEDEITVEAAWDRHKSAIAELDRGRLSATA